MASYQFFKHKNSGDLVHLDIDSNTFYQEKEQLFAQGFESHGDMIQADSTEEAYQRARNIMDEAVQQYGMAHPMGGLFYFIQGIFQLFKGKSKG